MNRTLIASRFGNALRASPSDFHDTVPDHFKNIRDAATDRIVIDASRIFDAPAVLQKAQIGQAAAESANKAKSAFLADISHEIRTPLGAIVGLASVLLSSKLDDRQRQCLVMLHGSAEALMTMLKGLLDISKIESGTIPLEFASFNMRALLHQITGIMSIKAEEKGIGLNLRCEAGFPETFVGDSGRIRQIVLNLIGNAIKFTETGGVTVSLAKGEEDNGRNQIFISVADTGIGIPSDKISAIFDRFIQADSSIAHEYGGTGLGLSISKALAENMGGGIGVASMIGKGSTFTLRLPLRGDEKEEDNVISHKFQPLTQPEQQFS